MMIRTIQMICFVGIMAGLTGCVTTSVSSDYDRSVDFTRYQRFDWLPETERQERKAEEREDNPFLEKRFKRLLREEIEYGGYQFDLSDPDFYVAYHTSVRERLFTSYAYDGCGHHGYHRRHHDHFGYPYHGGYSTYAYDETTLTIDIIDAKTNELLWRGWTYDSSYLPSLSEKRMRKAIRKILSKFPPQPKA